MFLVPQKNYLRSELRESLWISDRWVDIAYDFELTREAFAAGIISSKWGIEGDEFESLMKQPFLQISEERRNQLFLTPFPEDADSHKYFGSILYVSESYAKHIFSKGSRDHSESFSVYPILINWRSSPSKIKKSLALFVEHEAKRRGTIPTETRGSTSTRKKLKLFGAYRLLLASSNAVQAFCLMSSVLSKDSYLSKVYPEEKSLAKAARRGKAMVKRWLDDLDSAF